MLHYVLIALLSILAPLLYRLFDAMNILADMPSLNMDLCSVIETKLQGCEHIEIDHASGT